MRIETIIRHCATARLGIALAIPILVGMLDAPPLRAQPASGARLAFEVASVKENKSPGPGGLGMQFLPGGRFVARNMPLFVIISTAYDLPINSNRLSGLPEWTRFIKYDIDASAESGAIPAGTSALVRNQKLHLMLQTLLADRFQMKMRRQTSELPIYALTVARGGPKLHKSAQQEADCGDKTTVVGDPAECHSFAGGQGRGVHGKAVSLADIAGFIANWTDRPVVDRTGLQGLYQIDTEGWLPMLPRPPRPAGQPPSDEDLAFADPAVPTLFQIFDRVGLKLEPQKGPVDTFVVEAIERPSEN